LILIEDAIGYIGRPLTATRLAIFTESRIRRQLAGIGVLGNIGHWPERENGCDDGHGQPTDEHHRCSQ
jgi:hypothetical protein